MDVSSIVNTKVDEFSILRPRASRAAISRAWAIVPIEDVSTLDEWKKRPLYGDMETDTPIRKLIDSWPTRRALADQIGAQTDAVHKWASSGRIPADWQAAVVTAARENGFGHVTAEWMLEQHRREAGAA